MDVLRTAPSRNLGRDLRAGEGFGGAASAASSCSGRRQGRWGQCHCRRWCVPGGRVRLVRPPRGDRRRVGYVLRRRCCEHRVGTGDSQPRRGLDAPGLLLHREQAVCGLYLCRRGHHGAPAVGSGARCQHPQLPSGQYGPARSPPGHDLGGRAHDGRQRLDHRRRQRLPLLPPERPFPSAFGYRTKDGSKGCSDRDPSPRSPHISSVAAFWRRSRSRLVSPQRRRIWPGSETGLSSPFRQTGSASNPPNRRVPCSPTSALGGLFWRYSEPLNGRRSHYMPLRRPVAATVFGTAFT